MPQRHTAVFTLMMQVDQFNDQFAFSHFILVNIFAEFATDKDRVGDQRVGRQVIFWVFPWKRISVNIVHVEFRLADIESFQSQTEIVVDMLVGSVDEYHAPLLIGELGPLLAELIALFVVTEHEVIDAYLYCAAKQSIDFLRDRETHIGVDDFTIESLGSLCINTLRALR